MSNIRIGIVGYGNLGRGVEASVKLQPDMELCGFKAFVEKASLIYSLTSIF